MRPRYSFDNDDAVAEERHQVLAEILDPFTADSGAVLTCGKDGKARLTAGPAPDGGAGNNTATRLREFVGHNEAVYALAVDAKGKFLVTGGKDRTVRVWEITSGKQLRSFQGHMSPVLAVAIRPDGRQVATCGKDGLVHLWDASTWQRQGPLRGHTGTVFAVAYSPDGKRLASTGADTTVRLWDVEAGKGWLTLRGHWQGITLLDTVLLDTIRQWWQCRVRWIKMAGNLDAIDLDAIDRDERRLFMAAAVTGIGAAWMEATASGAVKERGRQSRNADEGRSGVHVREAVHQ